MLLSPKQQKTPPRSQGSTDLSWLHRLRSCWGQHTVAWLETRAGWPPHHRCERGESGCLVLTETAETTLACASMPHSPPTGLACIPSSRRDVPAANLGRRPNKAADVPADPASTCRSRAGARKAEIVKAWQCPVVRRPRTGGRVPGRPGRCPARPIWRGQTDLKRGRRPQGVAEHRAQGPPLQPDDGVGEGGVPGFDLPAQPPAEGGAGGAQGLLARLPLRCSRRGCRRAIRR